MEDILLNLIALHMRGMDDGELRVYLACYHCKVRGFNTTLDTLAEVSGLKQHVVAIKLEALRKNGFVKESITFNPVKP